MQKTPEQQKVLQWIPYKKKMDRPRIIWGVM